MAPRTPNREGQIVAVRWYWCPFVVDTLYWLICQHGGKAAAATAAAPACNTHVLLREKSQGFFLLLLFAARLELGFSGGCFVTRMAVVCWWMWCGTVDHNEKSENSTQ